MADAYQSAGGSNIGSLLRMIQEDKQNSPLAIPPTAEQGSPIRNLVQGPLSQVESPESAHVFATRPELSSVVPPAAPQTVVPGAAEPATGPVVGPVAPEVHEPGVAAPVGPAAPAQHASAPGVAPAAASAVKQQPISLATRIVPGSVTPSAASTKPSPTGSTISALRSPGVASYGGAPILSTELASLGGLATKLLPAAQSFGKAAVGKLAGGVTGGLSLANTILEKSGLGSFGKPKKAF